MRPFFEIAQRPASETVDPHLILNYGTFRRT